MNKEGYALSAHNWSSQQGVGSLSRIGHMTENKGTVLTATYREDNFPHLLGLHKLKDIQLIQFWLDRANKTVKLETVLRKIRNSTFTDSMVKTSSFYPTIQARYEKFSYDNLTTLNYTDVIINFNPDTIHSRIQSDYILSSD